MITTTLSDEKGRVFKQPVSVTFFRNELIVRLCRSDDPSQIASMGPHFYVDLPSSIRIDPFDAKPAVYEGTGNLGTINMTVGAAGRDGTDSHRISKVSAESSIENLAFHLDMVMEVGSWISETLSGDTPLLKEGSKYRLRIEVPFNELLAFTNLDAAEFSEKFYADKLKSNFGFEVPGYESMKYV